MTGESYPSTLTPDHTEDFVYEGTLYRIPGVTLQFKKWIGDTIANTFGGKPLIDYEGIPMFAELAIQRTAIKGGWNARWVETYASKGGTPYYFTEWSDLPLNQQVVTPLNDTYHEELLANIALKNNNSFSGCWDVLMWKEQRAVFMESKRFKKDSVRNTQLNWLKAGLATGLRTDNFLIVQWDFIK
jgi:hypothetical protein